MSPCPDSCPATGTVAIRQTPVVTSIRFLSATVKLILFGFLSLFPRQFLPNDQARCPGINPGHMVRPWWWALWLQSARAVLGLHGGWLPSFPDPASFFFLSQVWIPNKHLESQISIQHLLPETKSVLQPSFPYPFPPQFINVSLGLGISSSPKYPCKWVK